MGLGHRLRNLEFSPRVASWHSLQIGSLAPKAAKTRASFILSVDQH